VKLTPRGAQIIGRIVIKRVLSAIVRPDETRETTKFVIVDAVGPKAAAEGIRVGDVVLPHQMSNIKLDGGVYVRPLLNEKDVVAHLRGVNLAGLAVQTDGGTEYVDFDSPKAAASIAECSAEALAVIAAAETAGESGRLASGNAQPAAS
jgi:hypothetical protein